MIPIAKNIFVIDEQGNHYEATYPKRAKGLVKKGRARFMDEKTICLACPPNEYLEETIMEENREAAVKSGHGQEGLTAADILKKIDELRADMNYLSDALKRIETIQEQDINLPSACEVKLVTKAEAMRDSVMARETTIQKLLAFYEKLYDDCTSDKVTAKQKFMIELVKSVPVTSGLHAPDFSELLRTANEMDIE